MYNTDIQPIVPYTPSEASPTLPPIPMTPFMEDDTPSPPASPTPRRNKAANGPIPRNDQDVVMTDDRSAPRRNPTKGFPLLPTDLASQPRPLMLSRSEGSIPNAEHSNTTNALPLVARLEAAAQQDDTLAPKRGTTCDPLDKYMKATMLTIHDAFLTSVLDHIDLALISKWEKCPGEKLLAQPFDTIAYDASMHTIIRNVYLPLWWRSPNLRM